VVLHGLTVAFKPQASKVFDKAIRAWLKLRHRAIARYGVESPLTLVRIVTLIGGFFYAHSFSSSLYGGLGGSASARRSQGCGLSIPFNLPPVVESSDGWKLNLGASL